MQFVGQFPAYMLVTADPLDNRPGYRKFFIVRKLLLTYQWETQLSNVSNEVHI